MEDAQMKFLTSRIVGWMRKSKAFTNHEENEHDLPLPEPRIERTMKEWLGQEDEEGEKTG
jgi:hypothetical protein